MRKLKAIGISCSPRRGGNTDILVQQVMTTVKEAGVNTEWLRISDMAISPCDACWTCAETGKCHIDDDMQHIYPKLLAADGIVIGSPVHMGYSVSGQAQVFFDRTLSLWHQQILKNKVGGCVVASHRRGGISAIRIISSFFSSHNIIMAGYASGYGLDPGAIRKDERALQEAITLGERLHELMNILRRNAP